MFTWLKNIKDKFNEFNTSVDDYAKEAGNNVMPVLAMVNKAKKLIENSDFENAEKILYEAMQLSPNDATVYKYLGICADNLYDYESAIEFYSKSAEINPQDKIIWYKLGMAQINSNAYEDAVVSFESASKVTPVNTDVQTGWGMAYFKLGNYSKAHEKFINAIKINRYNFSAILLSSISEIRLGMFDDAEKKLRFLITTKPTEGAYYEYANLMYIKERYDEALKFAKGSLKINSKMLPAYLLAGRLLSLKYDYENSVKYFSTAEEKGLESAVLYTEWGTALLSMYRFIEAKEILRKVFEFDENSVNAKTLISYCDAELGNFDAIGDYDDSDEQNVYILMIEAIKCQNPKDSVEHLKKVLLLDKNLSYAYYHLAKAYEKLQNDDMVRDSYDKFIKVNPNYAQIYYEYAKYLISKSDLKDAQRKLNKAQKLDDNNQEILNLLFYVDYMLVKDNVCEYNIKEAISLADKISEFKYPELKSELAEMLENLK